VDVSDSAQTLYSHEFRGFVVRKVLPEIGPESSWQGAGPRESDGRILADTHSDLRVGPGSGGAALTTGYFLAPLIRGAWLSFGVSFAPWRLGVKKMSHARTRRGKVEQKIAGTIHGPWQSRRYFPNAVAADRQTSLRGADQAYGEVHDVGVCGACDQQP
jgi:hypothetical protein